jgi:hypothetical protein
MYWPDTDKDWENYKQEIPRCPYCGFEDQDYWEWAYCLPENYDTMAENWEEVDCESCEATYDVAHHIEHAWTTKKKEEKNETV